MPLNKKESFGLNNKLKKFNELFDTEDIKARLELPMLQGDIDFKKLSSSPSGVDTDSEFALMHDKLAQFHPFLELCLGGNDSELSGCGKDEFGTFKYYFTDKNWIVFLAIDKKAKGSFVSSIMYKKYSQVMTEDNMTVIRGSYLGEYDESRVIVELYDGISFEELVNDVIGVSFKDILTDLGLGHFLNNPTTQELKQSYEN